MTWVGTELGDEAGVKQGQVMEGHTCLAEEHGLGSKCEPVQRRAELMLHMLYILQFAPYEQPGVTILRTTATGCIIIKFLLFKN